jgi:hypothetical protein
LGVEHLVAALHLKKIASKLESCFPSIYKGKDQNKPEVAIIKRNSSNKT